MAVMFGGMLMRLEPLLEFSLWGSDWGEYYHLTERLVEDGSHAQVNLGWGRAYVDFPGMFDLTGAIAAVTGVSTATAMTYVLPCVTVISCIVAACIVLRLGGGPRAALVSAVLLAVLFPEVFTNSHPVPGPIGSMLLMGALLVYLLGDTWRRDEGVEAERPMVLYGLMMLLLLGLTVTHHMSHFFLILVLGMAYLLRAAMVKGAEPDRDSWALWSLVATLALATVYWLLVAETFREEVMVDLAGVPGHYMVALAWIGLAPLVLIGRGLRRRRDRVPDLSFWGARELAQFMVAYFAVGTVIVALVAFFGFPGTDIVSGGDLFLYMMPTVAAFALLIGSTDVVLRFPGGHVIVAWAAVLTLSFLAMSALENQVLVPYRHVPYIAEALVILAGVGAVHLYTTFRPSGPRLRTARATAVVLGVVLVAAVAATAYPPKAVMGGFQEGTTESELAAVLWTRGGLPAPGAAPDDLSSGVVATDHRLSSMVFGIGGRMATWDTAGPVLHGARDDSLWMEMDDMDTPHGDRPVTAVVLSEDFRSGAALSQFSSPHPVEGEAWDKFLEPPFYKVYDGGDVLVVVAARPLDATGEP